MLRVATSQQVNRVEARGEVRDSLDQRLVDWLREVGVIAIPVPNTLQRASSLARWLAAIRPQAIVLSGGNNIGSSQERDDTETALLEYATVHHLPLLGICRGMQMMAHHVGTELKRVPGHANTRHALHPTAGALGFTVDVNSFHDWCLAGCPSGYDIIATAGDGTPEAIRHRSRAWEGWMWHPEREAPFALKDIQRARVVFHSENSA